jgi:hypothetical protein
MMLPVTYVHPPRSAQQQEEACVRKHFDLLTTIGLGLGLALALAQSSVAQQNPVTAVDIALEPDATMIQHAMDANARLLKDFPKGFALDATHHPHISMLQQFVRTDDLDKVYAAANAVLAKEKPTAWTLKAFTVSTTTFRLRRSASPESSSNQLKTCIGCKMNSYRRSNPSP